MKTIKDKNLLNVAQCVEILLRQGVESDAWHTIKTYTVLGCSEGDAWQAEHNTLYAHHINEVAFLKQVIKELCDQVKTLDEQLDTQLDKVEKSRGDKV